MLRIINIFLSCVNANATVCICTDPIEIFFLCLSGFDSDKSYGYLRCSVVFQVINIFSNANASVWTYIEPSKINRYFLFGAILVFVPTKIMLIFQYSARFRFEALILTLNRQNRIYFETFIFTKWIRFHFGSKSLKKHWFFQMFLNFF